MLYVHPKKIEQFDTISKDDLQKIVDEYNAPKDDPEFLEQLYERKIVKKKLEKLDDKSEADTQKYWDELLRFRHGISPISKNIRNIRYKKKPQFDIEKVKRIETILKDLIDFGFADHVDEHLLDFDDEGNLRDAIDGKNERKGARNLGPHD